MSALIDNPGIVIDGLHAAVDDAADVPLSCLPPAELADMVTDLQGVRTRIEALICAVTAEARAAGAATVAGHRTVAAMIGERTGCDPSVVGSDQAVGRWLETFTEFAQAFAAGTFSRRHVQLLKAKDTARTRSAMLESQGFFIEKAQTLDWNRFCVAVDYWVLAADPDGDEPRRQLAARRLRLTRSADGMTRGEFELDPLVGAAVRSALDREVSRQMRADGSVDDARTIAQRYADALTDLIAAGSISGGRTPAPLIHISMSPLVAEDMLVRRAYEDDDGVTHYPLPAGVDPDRLPISFDDLDGRCEFADGTPVHPRLALAAMATAELRRLVMEAESEILDLGRTVRTYPKKLKVALIAAARGRCAEAGCDAPTAWLEADHHIPWSKGGRTSTENAEARCRPHNLAKGDRMPP